MYNKEKSINQIIKELLELEAKGCHSVSIEYGEGLFRVKIFHGVIGLGKIIYEKQLNTKKEQAEMEKLSNLIETLSNRVFTTVFQCYRQEFVKGEKSGSWEKIKPIFEFGENALHSMLYDGSGYYIDDPENSFLYFVDMKKESEL